MKGNFTKKFDRVELNIGSLNIQGGADNKLGFKDVHSLISSCDIFHCRKHGYNQGRGYK